MSEIEEKRLTILLRHIQNVQKDCITLGEKLIENEGEEEFGKLLIANGMVHDNSKFKGIEWLYLHEGVQEDKFKLAAKQHITTNMHHIEYWGTPEEMPRVYVAEMCCDWHARSSEFGTDLWGWIKEKACKKYSIHHNSRIYKQIKDFLDLLLEKSFSK